MKNGQIYNAFRIESNFIDIPLTLKYRARRVNNYAPYLITGFAARWDLASRRAYDADNNVYVLLNPFDVYWETGIGIDYYLFYFKFATEFKFSLGLTDVMNHSIATKEPQYVYAIDRLTSKLVMISFHFE